MFPACELMLSIFNIAPPSAADDPFVGFAGIRPLFEADASGRFMHTSPARRGFFEEDSFLREKPDDEFRIFVFGGSTVQGNPYSIQTSFTRFLQIALNQAAPSTSWKVVNCGGISYASYRLLPLMEECLQYQPDLMIVCTGHNEFLEDVTYTYLLQTPVAITRVYSLLGRFRCYRLLRSLMWNSSRQAAGDMAPPSMVGGQRDPTGRSKQDAMMHDQSKLESQSNPGRPVLSMEVDALLDHQGGLQAYVRDDRHAALVAAHFQSNLLRMYQLCSDAGLPMLLVHPPSNLSDCPPFKAEFDPQLPEASCQAVRELLSQASSLVRDQPDKAVQCLRQATELDSRFAFAWYQLGHALLAVNDPDSAKAAFIKARDEDVCPLRMTSALDAAMLAMIQQSGCPYLDAADVLQQHCLNGITGDNVLVDHIHPSFRSHQWIGLAITDWMQSAGILVEQADDWRSGIDSVFEQHLQSLNNMYFLKGRRRLQDLQGWAAGRAEGPPVVRKPRRLDAAH